MEFYINLIISSLFIIPIIFYILGGIKSINNNLKEKKHG